jgi:hypothetical protein
VTKAEELLFDGARPGLKFALGENPKFEGGATQLLMPSTKGHRS